MVTKMKTIYETTTVGGGRTTFIELLSAEFTSRTGFGVYVYLTPIAINSLFNLYLENGQTITLFVRQYVRHYSNEHNV